LEQAVVTYLEVPSRHSPGDTKDEIQNGSHPDASLGHYHSPLSAHTVLLTSL